MSQWIDTDAYARAADHARSQGLWGVYFMILASVLLASVCWYRSEVAGHQQAPMIAPVQPQPPAAISDPVQEDGVPTGVALQLDCPHDGASVQRVASVRGAFLSPTPEPSIAVVGVVEALSDPSCRWLQSGQALQWTKVGTSFQAKFDLGACFGDESSAAQPFKLTLVALPETQWERLLKCYPQMRMPSADCGVLGIPTQFGARFASRAIHVNRE